MAAACAHHAHVAELGVLLAPAAAVTATEGVPDAAVVAVGGVWGSLFDVCGLSSVVILNCWLLWRAFGGAMRVTS